MRVSSQGLWNTLVPSEELKKKKDNFWPNISCGLGSQAQLIRLICIGMSLKLKEALPLPAKAGTIHRLRDSGWDSVF